MQEDEDEDDSNVEDDYEDVEMINTNPSHQVTSATSASTAYAPATSPNNTKNDNAALSDGAGNESDGLGKPKKLTRHPLPDCRNPKLGDNDSASDDDEDDDPSQSGMKLRNAAIGNASKRPVQSTRKNNPRASPEANRITKSLSKSTGKRLKKADLKSKDMTQAEKRKVLWSEIINKSGFKPIASDFKKGLTVKDCRGQPPAGCSREDWGKKFRSADSGLQKRVVDPKLAKNMREEGWTYDQALALYTRRHDLEQQEAEKQKKGKNDHCADDNFEACNEEGEDDEDENE